MRLTVGKEVFLSVVIPVFNEDRGLQKNIEVICSHLSEITEGYQLLLIDDGSTDDTWKIVRDLSREDSRISGLRLSRNYGKESAIYAGLARADGKHVLVMDSDLQHPPAAIPAMVELYLSDKLDVLDAIKRTRSNENFLYKISAGAFYRIFSRVSGMDIRRASDFKIISKQVTESLVNLPENALFFRGLTSWVGFKHGTFEYDVNDRIIGQSRWSISRLFRLGVNAITSYTSSLLHIVSFQGIIFLFFGMVLGAQTLYNKLAGQAVDGFTTVILLLLLIGASIMISLGIIGQYIAKIYDEVKGRPRYIIKDET